MIPLVRGEKACMKLPMSIRLSCPRGRSLSMLFTVVATVPDICDSIWPMNRLLNQLAMVQEMLPVMLTSPLSKSSILALPVLILSLLLLVGSTTKSMSAVSPRSGLPLALESKVTLHLIQAIKIFCSNLIGVLVLTLARMFSWAVLWGVGVMVTLVMSMSMEQVWLGQQTRWLVLQPVGGMSKASPPGTRVETSLSKLFSMKSMPVLETRTCMALSKRCAWGKPPGMGCVVQHPLPVEPQAVAKSSPMTPRATRMSTTGESLVFIELPHG